MTTLARQEAGLLAAVIEEPSDLAVRMVYADWLEDTGVPENLLRAEFIRLQFDLEERHREPCRTGQGSVFQGSPPFACRHKGCPACGPFLPLLDRERALLYTPDATGKRYGDRWMAGLLGAVPEGWFGTDVLAGGSLVVWRRGFVEEVTARVTDWRRHGPRMAREAPLTAVRLAGVSPAPTYSPSGARWWASSFDDVAYPGHFVPRFLAAHLDGARREAGASGGPLGRSHLYPSREEALSDLSRAALLYAQEDPEDYRGEKKKARRRKAR